MQRRGRRRSTARGDLCRHGGEDTGDRTRSPASCGGPGRHFTSECFPPPSPHEVLRYLAISARYSSRFRFLACSSVSGPADTGADLACVCIAEDVS